MSVVKVIEIMAESDQSWEAAAQNAITATAKTISDIKSVYVSDFEAVVEENKIVKYRVNTKISFLVRDK